MGREGKCASGVRGGKKGEGQRTPLFGISYKEAVGREERRCKKLDSAFKRREHFLPRERMLRIANGSN